MTSTTPQTQPDHVPSEGVEDGAYYAKDGAVWKEPVTTRKPDGSRVISIGFKVCTMTDVVGEEAAESVAALMNAGAATALSSSAAAGSAGWKLVPVEPDKQMLSRGGFHCITHAGPVNSGDLAQAKAVWKAMLAAAPSAPTPTEASRSETGRGENVDAACRAHYLVGVEAGLCDGTFDDLPENMKDAARAGMRAAFKALAVRPVSEDALRDVVEAARRMPRATPAPGGAGTIHQFPIEAGAVWMLDRALLRLDALANTTQPVAGQGAGDGLVDQNRLDDLFSQIPSGPWDASRRGGGHEVRQIDTDPTNKHHYPFRLCQSIAGQKAKCDNAVFDFIAGVLNAWPQISAALANAHQPDTGQEAGVLPTEPCDCLIGDCKRQTRRCLQEEKQARLTLSTSKAAPLSDQGDGR
jgi:hypothetical protein